MNLISLLTLCSQEPKHLCEKWLIEHHPLSLSVILQEIQQNLKSSETFQPTHTSILQLSVLFRPRKTIFLNFESGMPWTHEIRERFT